MRHGLTLKHISLPRFTDLGQAFERISSAVFFKPCSADQLLPVSIRGN